MKMYFSKLYCATSMLLPQRKNLKNIFSVSDHFTEKRKSNYSCVRELKNELQTHWNPWKPIFLCSAFLAIHTTAKWEHGIFSNKALYFRAKMIHLGTLIKKKKKGMSWGIISRHCTEDSYWSTTQFLKDSPAQKSNVYKKAEIEKEKT